MYTCRDSLGSTQRPLHIVGPTSQFFTRALQVFSAFTNATGIHVDTAAVPMMHYRAVRSALLADDNPPNATSGYDAIITTPSTFGSVPEESGKILDITPLMDAADHLINFATMQRLFRENLAVLGPKVVAVPLISNVFLLYYHMGLFERYNLTVPQTWDELAAAAEQYNGADTDGDGTPDLYGLCMMPQGCGGDPLFLRMVYASYAQTLGPSSGLDWDATTLEPLAAGPAMAEALQMLRRLRQAGPQPQGQRIGCLQDVTWFAAGKCLMSITNIAAFKTGSIGQAPGAAPFPIRGRMGVALLPGSTRVLDRTKGKVVDCDTLICPHADGQATTEDGRPLPVNRPIAVHSQVVIFNGLSQPLQQFQAFALFSYVASPAVSGVRGLLLDNNELTPIHAPDLDVANLPLWVARGYDAGDTTRFLLTWAKAIATSNLVMEPKFPGASAIIDAFSEVAVQYTYPAAGPNGTLEELMHELEAALAATVTAYGGEERFRDAYRRAVSWEPAAADDTPVLPPAHSASKPWLGRGIAVGMVVGIVLCVAAALVVLLRRWRRRAQRHPPPGAGPLTTLLVTDIQDSTLLWEGLPAHVMDESLKLHHACLRRALLAHGGYESATEGDSFILAFGQPERALAYAVHVQQALLSLPWPPGLLCHEPLVGAAADSDDPTAEVYMACRLPPAPHLRLKLQMHQSRSLASMRCKLGSYQSLGDAATQSAASETFARHSRRLTRVPTSPALCGGQQRQAQMPRALDSPNGHLRTLLTSMQLGSPAASDGAPAGGFRMPWACSTSLRSLVASPLGGPARQLLMQQQQSIRARQQAGEGEALADAFAVPVTSRGTSATRVAGASDFDPAVMAESATLPPPLLLLPVQQQPQQEPADTPEVTAPCVEPSVACGSGLAPAQPAAGEIGEMPPTPCSGAAAGAGGGDTDSESDSMPQTDPAAESPVTFLAHLQAQWRPATAPGAAASSASAAAPAGATALRSGRAIDSSASARSRSAPPVLVFRGLRVRMGLHTGVHSAPDVSRNAASNRVQFSGTPLRMAKAVADAGHGGMVVITESMRAALSPMNLKSSRLLVAWLGCHEASADGLPPLHLYQVCSQSLAARLLLMQRPLRVRRTLLQGVQCAPVLLGAAAQLRVVGAGILLAWDEALARRALAMMHGALLRTLESRGGAYVAEGAASLLQAPAAAGGAAGAVLRITSPGTTTTGSMPLRPVSVTGAGQLSRPDVGSAATAPGMVSSANTDSGRLPTTEGNAMQQHDAAGSGCSTMDGAATAGYPVGDGEMAGPGASAPGVFTAVFSSAEAAAQWATECMRLLPTLEWPRALLAHELCDELQLESPVPRRHPHTPARVPPWQPQPQLQQQQLHTSRSMLALSPSSLVRSPLAATEPSLGAFASAAVAAAAAAGIVVGSRHHANATGPTTHSGGVSNGPLRPFGTNAFSPLRGRLPSAGDPPQVAAALPAAGSVKQSCSDEADMIMLGWRQASAAGAGRQATAIAIAAMPGPCARTSQEAQQPCHESCASGSPLAGNRLDALLQAEPLPLPAATPRPVPKTRNTVWPTNRPASVRSDTDTDREDPTPGSVPVSARLPPPVSTASSTHITAAKGLSTGQLQLVAGGRLTPQDSTLTLPNRPTTVLGLVTPDSTTRANDSAGAAHDRALETHHSDWSGASEEAHHVTVFRGLRARGCVVWGKLHGQLQPGSAWGLVAYRGKAWQQMTKLARAAHPGQVWTTAPTALLLQPTTAAGLYVVGATDQE